MKPPQPPWLYGLCFELCSVRGRHAEETLALHLSLELLPKLLIKHRSGRTTAGATEVGWQLARLNLASILKAHLIVRASSCCLTSDVTMLRTGSRTNHSLAAAVWGQSNWATVCSCAP